MTDDTKILEEALEQPDEIAAVQYLVDRADQLSDEVRNRLMLSMLSRTLQDEAKLKSESAELLESIAEALKQTSNT
jgi:hypothetical protein